LFVDWNIIYKESFVEDKTGREAREAHDSPVELIPFSFGILFAFGA
jgi:hypothetical protein